ncbi:MAG: D-xylose 1-dehydrogenase Gfo6 [Halobacteriaceae archaeon]
MSVKKFPSLEPFRNGDWIDPDQNEPLKIAIIGLGNFATELVAPSAMNSSRVDIGAMVSGSKEKAIKYTERFDGVALTYEEFATAKREDAYDAAYIITPNATHLEYTKAAANQGKAVLCEKPIERDATRANKVQQVCDDAGVLLQVAYRLQVDPAIRWAREVIKRGCIGTPIHAQGVMSQDIFQAISPDEDQWRLDPELSGGAAFIDLGIYPLNTIRFLTDRDPIAVCGTTRNPDNRFEGVDQHTSATVVYEGGLLGSFSVSQLSTKEDLLHIVGTEGTMEIDPAFFGDVKVKIEREDRSQAISFPDTNEIRAQLDYFASHVTRDERPEPDGTHAVVDMEAIDGIYEAAATGEWIQLTN